MEQRETKAQVIAQLIDLSKERGGDYADAFGMFMSELEAARTSITNSTHE